MEYQPRFQNICGVHAEISKLSNRAHTLTESEMVDNLNEISDIVETARNMGQTLEDALKDRDNTLSCAGHCKCPVCGSWEEVDENTEDHVGGEYFAGSHFLICCGYPVVREPGYENPAIYNRFIPVKIRWKNLVFRFSFSQAAWTIATIAWYLENKTSFAVRHLREFQIRQETKIEICGLCDRPGADKLPHPEYWPGEQRPETEFVHAECEYEECGRAHAALSPEERKRFLKSI
jgi:hypothetical protein